MAISKQQKREIKLSTEAKRAGCELRFDDDEKLIMVSMPDHPRIKIGIDKTDAIDSFLKTGKPSAADIVAAAKERADRVWPLSKLIMEQEQERRAKEQPGD